MSKSTSFIAVTVACVLLFNLAVPVFAGSSFFDEQRKFTGHEYDRETNLSYMNARYYNGGIGRFISQDAAFLLLGDTQFEQKYARKLEQHLSDPQNLNSYSYVTNNPLKYVDEGGEILPLIAVAYGAFEIGSTLYDGYVALTTWLNANSSPTDKALSTGSVIIGLYRGLLPNMVLNQKQKG